MPGTERQPRKSTVEKVIESLEEHKLAAYHFTLPILRYLSCWPPSMGYIKAYIDMRTFFGYSGWVGDRVGREVLVYHLPT